ncbi:hypothetical protein ACM0L0_00305 [Mycoplasma sp. 005V]|uniref:hypothetical protein n=1 Tax=Mycoplasma sp. 005V TaxID=3398776 RepID=UPI003A84FF4E
MKEKFLNQLEQAKTYLVIVFVTWIVSIVLGLISYILSAVASVTLQLYPNASIIGYRVTTAIFSILTIASVIIGLVYGIKLIMLSNDTKKLFTKMVYETSVQNTIAQPDLIKLLAYSRTIERLFIFNLIGFLSGPILLIINCFFTRNAITSAKNVLDLLNTQETDLN